VDIVETSWFVDKSFLAGVKYSLLPKLVVYDSPVVGREPVVIGL
jgi:hypothetical protein